MFQPVLTDPPAPTAWVIANRELSGPLDARLDAVLAALDQRA